MVAPRSSRPLGAGCGSIDQGIAGGVGYLEHGPTALDRTACDREWQALIAERAASMHPEGDSRRRAEPGAGGVTGLVALGMLMQRAR